ncbi:hypothetical protein HanRHA438_Chr06g0273591 [Helianthus annuus]|nr:hypothetical protein HanRHA438_Chr06g0273591 [Helianthus annuus]
MDSILARIQINHDSFPYFAKTCETLYRRHPHNCFRHIYTSRSPSPSFKLANPDNTRLSLSQPPPENQRPPETYRPFLFHYAFSLQPQFESLERRSSEDAVGVRKHCRRCPQLVDGKTTCREFI